MESLQALPAAGAGGAGTQALIARSWQRSIDRHGLDPARLDAPRVLSAGALREHLEPMQPLLELARLPLQWLHEQVRDAGYVVLLTDAEGITLRMLRDARLDRALRHAGLHEGSAWQEPREGTCAVALSALERVALTVHHGEHFRAANRSLTCSAAPVLAPDGRVLAVVDASALDSPDDKRSQHLVLQMVRQAARTIEDAWFLQSFADQWVLHIGSQTPWSEVATDGLLAVDGAGRVLAANARLRDAGFPGREALVGRPLRELLGIDLQALCAAAAHDPQALLRLAALPAGHAARLRWPRRRTPAPAPRAPTVGLHPALEALAGGDAAMQEQALRAQRLLGRGLNLLLQGESGTGKEAFAKALHEASARSAGPFVAIDCSALPETLIESELFGYSPGSFTGAARQGARGRIAQARHGTLFLDEIGDMPLALQTRLLRVLAEREVQPLGGRTASALDAQVICASHRDLRQLADSGAFRLDLLYRINGVTLHLPALRARDDREQLFERVLADEAAALGVVLPRVEPAAWSRLLAHDWPGNLRELHNALRALLLLADDGLVGVALVDAAIHPRGAAVAPTTPRSATEDPAQALRDALRACGGNVSEAARRLGIGRATMYRRMQRLGVAPPQRLFDPGDTGC